MFQWIIWIWCDVKQNAVYIFVFETFDKNKNCWAFLWFIFFLCFRIFDFGGIFCIYVEFREYVVLFWMVIKDKKQREKEAVSEKTRKRRSRQKKMGKREKEQETREVGGWRKKVYCFGLPLWWKWIWWWQNVCSESVE